MKPFLRWAGGKQAIARRLIQCLPVGYDGQEHTYFEPFLGAGSLFLRLAPKRALVSDLNPHLINLFRTIKENPSELSRQCKLHEHKNSAEYYYRIRELLNRDARGGGIKQASRFLYLNRSCFNGVFRVNQKGEYNVPYGDKPHLLMPTLQQFRDLGERFRGTQFRVCSFEKTLCRVDEADFVYLDPPYPPLNGTSYFTHYTKERFGDEDQKRVAEFAASIRAKGGHVLITNADTKRIRALYEDWHIHRISTRRYISCKAMRHEVGELVITSYETGAINE